MLSSVRRMMIAAASTGVARSSSGSGLLGNHPLLAALLSDYAPLCQHALCILNQSLLTMMTQQSVKEQLQDGYSVVVVELCRSMKGKLVAMDFTTGGLDIADLFTATYLFRTTSTLARFVNFSRDENRRAVGELLVEVINVFPTKK